MTGVQTCALPICFPVTILSHAMSFIQINGLKLDIQTNKSGISTLTPLKLALKHHSLPPILHIFIQIPMQNYSKGARGLSVQLQVRGIFTPTTNSLSVSLRQRPTRYAIHAGRNLPDKGLRYLRTVIVTAAVYRGFDSMLHLLQLTSPVNLPALGRRQTLYFLFRVCRALCFC